MRQCTVQPSTSSNMQTQPLIHPVLSFLNEKIEVKINSNRVDAIISVRRRQKNMNFDKLNERTILKQDLTSNMPILLGNLAESKYFSTLDLKSGCHQIMLAERERNKTSFSVNVEQYKLQRLPFGLKNAVSNFQKIIDEASFAMTPFMT